MEEKNEIDIWSGPTAVPAQSMNYICWGWNSRVVVCLLDVACTSDLEAGAFRKGKKMFTCPECKGVRLEKTGSSSKNTINTWKKTPRNIIRVLKCSFVYRSWLKQPLHMKSWLTFRHSIANNQENNCFSLWSPGLWDMFQVLLFWGPTFRQDGHVIFGLSQGAKWFFFLTGE